MIAHANPSAIAAWARDVPMKIGRVFRRIMRCKKPRSVLHYSARRFYL